MLSSHRSPPDEGTHAIKKFPARLRRPVTPVALGWLLAATFVGAGAAPLLLRWRASREVDERVAALLSKPGHRTGADRAETCSLSIAGSLGDAGSDTGLASWQSIGGCGAGASTGAGGGIKWVGRSVSGGAFNSQCQLSYTRLNVDPERPEDHVFGNVLVIAPMGERWSFGANVPLVYKYMRDPFRNGADLSNSGVGDISVQLGRRFGPIGATNVTASFGLPTGEHDGRYKMRILNQSQQRGFGKPTGTLTIDQVGDELWGLTVLGATASWRGGENDINNYRAPSASAYGYVGYFMGRFVPAVGLTLTALSGHDRDQTVEQMTGLYLAAPSVSIEWSNDWVALLMGASFPYQYDGFDRDTEGRARVPYGWGPWLVGVGLAFSPF